MRAGALLLILALGLPSVASASPREFNKLVKQAERLYEAGKYKESAERLIEAYAYQPHPRIIYNIARAYDQAGELDLALEYYQRYVNSSEGTDPTLLKRSALSIDRIRALVEAQQKARQQDAEQQAKLEAEAREAQERAAREEEAKRRAEQELRARERAQAEAAASAHKRNRILSFVLGGVAVAGLGTGTFFGVQANAAKGQFTAAETVETKQQLEGRTRSNALIADVGFGTGVVAAVVAVLLYPKGEPEKQKSTVMVPVPGGAGLQVRF